MSWKEGINQYNLEENKRRNEIILLTDSKTKEENEKKLIEKTQIWNEYVKPSNELLDTFGIKETLKEIKEEIWGAGEIANVSKTIKEIEIPYENCDKHFYDTAYTLNTSYVGYRYYPETWNDGYRSSASEFLDVKEVTLTIGARTRPDKKTELIFLSDELGPYGEVVLEIDKTKLQEKNYIFDVSKQIKNILIKDCSVRTTAPYNLLCNPVIEIIKKGNFNFAGSSKEKIESSANFSKLEPYYQKKEPQKRSFFR